MASNKEIKEACIGGAKFYRAYDLADDDGKISISDLQYLLDPVVYLPTAIAGAKDIPAELADLDDAELADIKAAVRAEVGDDSLADDIVVLIMVTGLNLAKLFLAAKTPVTP